MVTLHVMKKEDTLNEVLRHYEMVKEDNRVRQTRENGWNDVIDAYWGRLPDDWPFDSRVTIPLVRTSLTEKNARLINSKLRGRLVPREGADVLKAKINNAILDYQWDNANFGGSMTAKWKEMDMDARLMGSMFGLCLWKHTEEVKTDSKGKQKKVVTFDGNEFMPLNPIDCGIDPNAKNIKDARWFQYRKWTTIEDLQNENDISVGGNLYPGLNELKQRVNFEQANPQTQSQDRRDNEYIDRIKSLKGLQDRMGQDRVFPVVEIVTEYRPDRWITFSAKHKVILRDIPNPYAHGKIPVVQLNYYKIQDDPWGESEVEPVLPVWRAIQATVCAYLDTMIIHMRPPLIGVEGQFRQETIKYGPEEIWVVNSPGAVQEFRGNTEALNYFQTTFAAFINQFNAGMGDMSQGVGIQDMFNPKKTATEVRATQRQQNVRDQANQNELAESIKDMMMMWLSNNRQFLFADPTKKNTIIRIVGQDAYQAFKKAGLDQMETPTDVVKMVSDIIEAQGGDVSDPQIQQLLEAGQVPKFPIVMNPNEKNPENFQLRPKMEIDQMGNEADLIIVPEDLGGTYDYVADVQSMSSSFADQQAQAQQTSLMMLTSNPTVLKLLQDEGYRPNIRELLIKNIESAGDPDAERYFTKIEQTQPEQAGQTPGGLEQGAPSLQSLAQPGLPELPPTAPEGAIGQQMGGSPELSQPGGVLPGVPPVPSQGGGIL